jgi:transcriptional regulator with XRE-family HTH domain
MDSFASRLRADRERAGFTVRQLANETGISFSYITKIETGRAGKGVSPDIITALAEKLESDVLEYLFLSDVVPSPLKDLLSSESSRSFLRDLIGSRVKSSGWDRLQNALRKSNSKATARADKSRRSSVA